MEKNQLTKLADCKMGVDWYHRLTAMKRKKG